MEEGSGKILGRLGHVKLCNMHLQTYRCSAVDKVMSVQGLLLSNFIILRVLFIIDEMCASILFLLSIVSVCVILCH